MVGVVATVDKGGIARRLWIKFRNQSIFALYTPFFVCLASGELDSDTFRHFISQDVHFFKAFAQAYEMAEECAYDDEDQCEIRKLRKGVMKNLKLHDTVVREWGFELPEESSTSNNATVKYIEFLLAAASGKVKGEGFPGKIATPFEKTKLAAYILGAIAPLPRLYAIVSNEIQAFLDPDDSSHIYRKWIESYSSKSFEASALQIEDMLDQLSVSLTGEELEVIEKLYHQAIRLEVDFFSAQPLVQQTVVPLSRVQDPAEHRLTIYCDFDLTCTAIDSSAFLAQIAIVEAQKTDSNAKGQIATVEAQKAGSNANESETPLARTSSADLRNTWANLSSQYTEEYEQCLESIISSTCTTEEFNYKGLCEALELFSDFEKRANTRVVQSGVLKGLNMDDIKRSGQCLILQDGCRGFFQKIAENNNLKTAVHVLSYCWCGDLIRSAFSSGDLNFLNVRSNELAYEESITTGEIIKKMESPMEKLQAYNDILKASGNEEKNLTVYIGGTVGDLLCLLQADVGIVIGSSLSLRRLGDQFGISFVPLFSGLIKKQKELAAGGSSNWKGQSGILYTVSSWAEIHAFILGS